MLDYFDSIQIVNLEKRADRRSETNAELERLGYSIGSENINYFPAICPSSSEGFPTVGANGCFHSHLYIIENAIKDNIETLLILEDDVNFTKFAANVIPKVIENLKSCKWDIVYFSHDFSYDGKPEDLVATTDEIQCSHFYLLNRTVMPKLQEFLRVVKNRPPGHPKGGPMHYDGALNTFRSQNPDVVTLFTGANLGYQRPSESDIGHIKTGLRSSVFVKPILGSARKFKNLLLKRVR